MSPEFLVKMINEMPERAIVESVKKSVLAHAESNNQRTKNDLLTACMNMILKEDIKENGLKHVLNELQNLRMYNKYFTNNQN